MQGLNNERIQGIVRAAAIEEESTLFSIREKGFLSGEVVRESEIPCKIVEVNGSVFKGSSRGAGFPNRVVGFNVHMA